MLVNYLSAKAAKYDITVVYDGWLYGMASQSATRVRGVRVVFSKRGERADEVIKRMIDSYHGRAIVVTNDREIRVYAQAAGCEVANPSSLIRLPKPPAEPVFMRPNKKGSGYRQPKRRSPSSWRF